jgi:hypothetical protein
MKREASEDGRCTARRSQSFNAKPRFDAGYECELSREALAEMGAVAKRPRILGAPQPAQAHPAAKEWLLPAVLIGAAVIVGVFSMTRHEPAKRSSQPQNESISQPAPPVVAPAPRTTFVKLPPPRAELVKLPEWQVGTQRELILPNNLKVLGRLRGRLDAQWMLPQNGNSIGDAWAVGNDLYIWLVAPNEAMASWIDP